MAEFCTNCGAPLSGTFCGRCGHRAQSASAPPQPSPTPQPVVTPTAQSLAVPTPQPLASPTSQPVAPAQRQRSTTIFSAANFYPAADHRASLNPLFSSQLLPSRQPLSPPLPRHSRPRSKHRPAHHSPPNHSSPSSRSNQCLSRLRPAAKVFRRRQSFADRRRNRPGISPRGIWRGALWRSLGQAQSIFYYWRIVWL